MFFSVIHVLATIATVIFFCTASFMFYAIYGKGGMWDAGMLGSEMRGMLGCVGYWDAWDAGMRDAVAAVAMKFATGFKLH